MNNIFISSSFRDMQAERDMLRYIVLPEINVFLRKNYGQDTNIIDLRWGIDTSSESEEAISKTIIQITSSNTRTVLKHYLQKQ